MSLTDRQWAAMKSSKSDEWETPQSLFDKLDEEFNFEVDVCATPQNAKCPCYFTREDNGLVLGWGIKAAWMNPPYGKDIGKWVKKAYEESQNGCTVVCLLPARTDTRWFHDWCMRGEIRFLKGRLKFGGCTNSAPFPSMVVVFRHNKRVQ